MTEPGAALPLFALDLETSGPDPRHDRILAAGLAGPRPWQARGADEEALSGLLEALGPDPVRLVCHDARFQRAALEAWAARFGRALPGISWTCTLAQARSLCPDAGIARGLGGLAWRLGLRHGPRPPAEAALVLRLQAVLQAWERLRADLGEAAPLVYLAGPLRGDGSRAWIRHNQIQMLLLARWAQDVLPQATLFVPHCNFAFLDEARDAAGRVREQALRGCERMVARSDLLLLCGDEPSPGMRQELAAALRSGIPVHRMPGWDGFDPGAREPADGAA